MKLAVISDIHVGLGARSKALCARISETVPCR
jgi:hypothetical protein